MTATWPKPCECVGAELNRASLRPALAAFVPNDDGEIVCRFCWLPLEQQAVQVEIEEAR